MRIRERPRHAVRGTHALGDRSHRTLREGRWHDRRQPSLPVSCSQSTARRTILRDRVHAGEDHGQPAEQGSSQGVTRARRRRQPTSSVRGRSRITPSSEHFSSLPVYSLGRLRKHRALPLPNAPNRPGPTPIRPSDVRSRPGLQPPPRRQSPPLPHSRWRAIDSAIPKPTGVRATPRCALQRCALQRCALQRCALQRCAVGAPYRMTHPHGVWFTTLGGHGART